MIGKEKDAKEPYKLKENQQPISKNEFNSGIILIVRG